MSKIDKHKFSEHTYIIRKMFDETQVQYAKRLGVCERTIRNWEHAKVEQPLKKNFQKVQRQYRYFKHEVKQGVQIKMKRLSDKAIVWSRMRSFEDVYDTLIEHDFYRNDYVIEGFRRVNLVKSVTKSQRKKKSKKGLFTSFDKITKAYYK